LTGIAIQCDQQKVLFFEAEVLFEPNNEPFGVFRVIVVNRRIHEEETHTRRDFIGIRDEMHYCGLLAFIEPMNFQVLDDFGLESEFVCVVTLVQRIFVAPYRAE
jgi:hypothetical protein